MVFYHVTKKEHLQSILSNGLRPSSSGLDGPGVYMWKGPLQTAVAEADASLSDNHYEMTADEYNAFLRDLVLLSVTLPDDAKFLVEWPEYVVCERRISPDCIRSLGLFHKLVESHLNVNIASVNATKYKGEDKMKNTKISYLYRDADNYKTHNECVVKGVITKDQQQVILDCLDGGEYFIPSQVGLPEKRFDDGFTESDHCWFEMDDSSFEVTTETPTVTIQAEDLVNAFCAKKGKWDDTHFPNGIDPYESKKLSLADQIQNASGWSPEASNSSPLMPSAESLKKMLIYMINTYTDAVYGSSGDYETVKADIISATGMGEKYFEAIKDELDFVAFAKPNISGQLQTMPHAKARDLEPEI